MTHGELFIKFMCCFLAATLGAYINGAYSCPINNNPVLQCIGLVAVAVGSIGMGLSLQEWKQELGKKTKRRIKSDISKQS